ncbi:MAG: hypothetical protein Q8P95_04995 [bacterium]|nr:hypothetical protein [bacterium]
MKKGSIFLLLLLSAVITAGTIIIHTGTGESSIASILSLTSDKLEGDDLHLSFYPWKNNKDAGEIIRYFQPIVEEHKLSSNDMGLLSFISTISGSRYQDEHSGLPGHFKIYPRHNVATYGAIVDSFATESDINDTVAYALERRPQLFKTLDGEWIDKKISATAWMSHRGLVYLAGNIFGVDPLYAPVSFGILTEAELQSWLQKSHQGEEPILLSAATQYLYDLQKATVENKAESMRTKLKQVATSGFELNEQNHYVFGKQEIAQISSLMLQKINRIRGENGKSPAAERIARDMLNELTDDFSGSTISSDNFQLFEEAVFTLFDEDYPGMVTLPENLNYGDCTRDMHLKSYTGEPYFMTHENGTVISCGAVEISLPGHSVVLAGYLPLPRAQHSKKNSSHLLTMIPGDRDYGHISIFDESGFTGEVKLSIQNEANKVWSIMAKGEETKETAILKGTTGDDGMIVINDLVSELKKLGQNSKIQAQYIPDWSVIEGSSQDMIEEETTQQDSNTSQPELNHAAALTAEVIAPPSLESVKEMLQQRTKRTAEGINQKKAEDIKKASDLTQTEGIEGLFHKSMEQSAKSKPAIKPTIYDPQQNYEMLKRGASPLSRKSNSTKRGTPDEDNTGEQKTLLPYDERLDTHGAADTLAAADITELLEKQRRMKICNTIMKLDQIEINQKYFKAQCQL